MNIDKIHNQDCLDAMKSMVDNQFDLAIVDPPYGIDAAKMTMGKGSRNDTGKNKKKNWDNSIPSEEYFIELKRVSSNQIIWGANYMSEYMPNGKGWIYWNKNNGDDNNFSDGEFAYSSKGVQSRHFKVSAFDNLRGGKDRIHPTQKPVKLYEWLLMNYAKEGDKILDTHLGSGSIAIACHNLGYDLTGYELDKEYYDNAIKRIKNHQSQTRIF